MMYHHLLSIPNTAADLFFRLTLRYAFGDYDTDDWKAMIVPDTSAGNIMYQRGTILAVVPGKEEICKQKLLYAFEKMKFLPEMITVPDTFRQLEEATLKANQAVDEVKALGLIPGQCRVCRRLGM